MVIKFIILMYLFFSIVNANSQGKEIAEKFGLSAGLKASVQWQRIFSDKEKLKNYKLDILDDKQLQYLKEYLISHAADSDHPMVPGL
ncbi:MAG: hypothetical protein HXX81_01880 [Campylobacterales bacterium]|nr:hypothetical protein [Campylobacterales bacterium]